MQTKYIPMLNQGNTKSKINFGFSLSEEPGIWRYSSYLKEIPGEYRLSLNEGNTTNSQIDDNLWVKREDKNPTGSWKDRGMAYLVSWAFWQKKNNLVLSSSGNAAISAASYAKLANARLFAFVSETISKGKLNELKNHNAVVTITKRPLSDSQKFAKENNYFLLRPSLLEEGPEGYQTIAFELAEKLGIIDDIFIPVSSGVGLVGIVKGFRRIGFLPKIHLCQPAALCPLASIFDRDFISESKNITRAIVAKTTPLKEKIIGSVKDSGGFGWVCSNDEIIEAQNVLEKKDIFTSNEGALALSGFFKAKGKGRSLGKAVCLLTGKRYND